MGFIVFFFEGNSLILGFDFGWVGVGWGGGSKSIVFCFLFFRD